LPNAIKVDPALLTAIHDYMMTRPMREVEQLVFAIRRCG
jgi:hypothetical protein